MMPQTAVNKMFSRWRALIALGFDRLANRPRVPPIE
jgi:hypothetical protein